MRWYSVKKYKPPDDSYLAPILIRAVSNKYKINRLMLAEYDGKWMDWDNKDPIEDTKVGWDHTVTHFCIPEPVEIEE